MKLDTKMLVTLKYTGLNIKALNCKGGGGMHTTPSNPTKYEYPIQ